MADETGGSAFPYSFTTLLGEDVYDSGMTLRDWFAGQALVGLLQDDNRGGPVGGYAMDAYNFADRMIAERNK